MSKKLLELFSGQGSISKSFQARGWEVYRIDWSDRVEAELHADISKLTVDDVINLCGGVPDVIWASPDCTTYSIATHRHRTLKEGLKPKTEYAAQCDDTNWKMWKLIDQLISLGTKYYFVENPRGRMRHMPFVSSRDRYTVAYCAYGRKANASGYEDRYIMKPTDIWTNHSNPMFKYCPGATEYHVHGQSSAADKRDYLSRGEMPKMLCDHIATVADFITADRKRVELEARLDELNAIYGWSQEERTPLIFYPEHRSSDFAQMAANGMGTNFTVRERIAELKQELERL